MWNVVFSYMAEESWRKWRNRSLGSRKHSANCALGSNIGYNPLFRTWYLSNYLTKGPLERKSSEDKNLWKHAGTDNIPVTTLLLLRRSGCLRFTSQLFRYGSHGSGKFIWYWGKPQWEMCRNRHYTMQLSMSGFHADRCLPRTHLRVSFVHCTSN